MSIEEKKRQLNTLMIEYSQLKGDSANRGRYLTIKNQVADIMYSSLFHNMLMSLARKYYAGRGTKEDFETCK